MVSVENLSEDGSVQNYVGGEWSVPNADDGQDVVRFYTDENVYIERWPDS